MALLRALDIQARTDQAEVLGRGIHLGRHPTGLELEREVGPGDARGWRGLFVGIVGHTVAYHPTAIGAAPILW